MIVVSDTTPFRYLIEIEAVQILAIFFGEVFIPEKVAQELQRAKTPQQVKDWLQSPPGWLKIRQADTSLFTPVLPLHDGEREAFALAIELQAGALLIDENNGRKEAARIGLVVIPTLAVLELAAQIDLIDLPEIIDRLSKTTFHATRKLYDEVLARDRLRKESKS